MVGWMDGWLEKAEIKPTQPSLAGPWLSLAKFEDVVAIEIFWKSQYENDLDFRDFLFHYLELQPKLLNACRLDM